MYHKLDSWLNRRLNGFFFDPACTKTTNTYESALKCHIVNHLRLERAFSDDTLFANSGINPGIVIDHHDWKKLQAIWKDINKDCKEVYRKFTQSGQHQEENLT